MKKCQVTIIYMCVGIERFRRISQQFLKFFFFQWQLSVSVWEEKNGRKNRTKESITISIFHLLDTEINMVRTCVCVFRFFLWCLLQSAYFMTSIYICIPPKINHILEFFCFLLSNSNVSSANLYRTMMYFVYYVIESITFVIVKLTRILIKCCVLFPPKVFRRIFVVVLFSRIKTKNLIHLIFFSWH